MIAAKNIMTEDVAVIKEDMLVHDVAHLMLRDKVSGFPVVDKQGDMVGIITMTDLFRMINVAFGHEQQQIDLSFQAISYFKDMKAGQVMSREVVSIQPQTTLLEIIRYVLEKGIHVFPVMADGKLVGIVSRHDILNAVFSYLFK